MISEMNALITGASSGIGRAIAIAIASAGGAVCLVGRNLERLDTVAQAARVAARSVSMYQADLGSDRALEELAAYVRDDFKSLDTLIHCAGRHAAGSIEQISVAQFDELYRTNVRAPYALTQAFLPLLKSRKGQVVFINSSQGLRATANTGAYASTKHAMKALADSLRDEVNADGVRVVSIYPGRTATPTIKALYETEGGSYEPNLLQPDDIAQVVLNALQLPRTAEVTDIQIRPFIKSY
jgi:NADP-dependent 3-hydroxy acid dehydrogenase YdfG